jgi:hypothetical protein
MNIQRTSGCAIGNPEPDKTCPLPPASTASFTRNTAISYGKPTITDQVVDRCTGKPYLITEKLDANIFTGPWTLDRSNSNIHSRHSNFIPQVIAGDINAAS